ncbi:acyl-CoA dehydrogenase family protein [Aromatoleum toluolicum]|uniref:Medium-chain specific acyl-CoA dehydrogenase, mitochondrial n=1 Tax=Aromatoleum toluolicum TaxID=90060 RepID=A0ABX1NEB3_9RHOO|nr:acyl-CoA dehydrogenase family protein [Aromatoleum toluolicum]NMF97646.1 acyl-CoA dehydrogenase family protein [Aromatoleum toluolicum]
MDFNLSSEQKMLVETVRRFVENEMLPLEDEIEETGRLAPEKARALFEKSSANGMYAMNIPEEFGGGGLSAVDTMLVEEQFGHAKDILIRRAFGNVYEVLLKCDAAQRERWLVPAVRGERTCSIAITEPNAGSDAASIKTRAVADGKGGWKITGGKHFISDGEFSDFFVVSAVTDPNAGAKGISLFLVDKGTPGFIIGRDQKMMGLTGTSHVELAFDEVPVGPENLLGGEGQGFKLILETLGRVRLAQVCARAVGKSVRLLNLMISYAQERKQFGKPIGDFQLIQQMIADSVVEINASRLLVLDAANDIDNGVDARDKISMAKFYVAEVLGRVADRAVQVYGGMGYCADLPIERMYRDARIYRIFDGTSEIHRTVVARSAMKHGEALYGTI